MAKPSSSKRWRSLNAMDVMAIPTASGAVLEIALAA
jgi:hypothetical protein